MDIVIIGGVAAGMSAAARLRRFDEQASMTVVAKSGHISSARRLRSALLRGWCDHRP
ncbi:hypothetical protein [Luteococcus sp.]|uniref:hypothetical protein n=1 Tax=Luteococcus sp. TaxID=1969402 RepID=UPI0037351D8B